jgi:hypothetical protein
VAREIKKEAKAAERDAKFSCRCKCIEKVDQGQIELLRASASKSSAVRDVWILAMTRKTCEGTGDRAEKAKVFFAWPQTGIKICAKFVDFALGIGRHARTEGLRRALELTPGKVRRAGTKKVDVEVREAIKSHIEAKFDVASTHYGRAREVESGIRRLTDHSFTLSDLYRSCKEAGMDVNESVFRSTLKDLKIRVGFKAKDSCGACYFHAMQNAKSANNVSSSGTHVQHMCRAYEAIAEYREDILSAKVDLGETVVFTVDFWQAHYVPRLNVCKSFYSPKIGCYVIGAVRCYGNEKVKAVIDQKNSIFGTWTQLDGGKVSNETCTFVFNVAQQLPETTTCVVFWMDRCGNQNDNTYMKQVLVVLKAIRPQLRVVQKFFETGHSYNYADRAFALIARRIKNAELGSDVKLVEHFQAIFGNTRRYRPRDFIDWKSYTPQAGKGGKGQHHVFTVNVWNKLRLKGTGTKEFRAWEALPPEGQELGRLKGYYSIGDFNRGKAAVKVVTVENGKADRFRNMVKDFVNGKYRYQPPAELKLSEDVLRSMLEVVAYLPKDGQEEGVWKEIVDRKPVARKLLDNWNATNKSNASQISKVAPESPETYSIGFKRRRSQKKVTASPPRNSSSSDESDSSSDVGTDASESSLSDETESSDDVTEDSEDGENSDDMSV